VSRANVISEDDTFKALSRRSFGEVIHDMTFVGESVNTALRSIVIGVALGEVTPRADWVSFSGGWAWDDFKAECIKRYNEIR
jgi:hypothetical protein